GYGHTAKVAEAISKGVLEAKGECTTTSSRLKDNEWTLLDTADAIIFGAPTYMASVSGPFTILHLKDGLRKNGKIRLQLDLLILVHILEISLSAFNKYFILLCNMGQVEKAPQFGDNEMPTFDRINRLGSYSGLMTQSNHKSSSDIVP
ncbi:unnamed protein product, partial [Oppiella nova]